MAGGTGLLSFALAQRGLCSVTVDPRRSCGCLPSRARKAARKTGVAKLPLGGRCCYQLWPEVRAIYKII